ncbi:class I SAM-dependent methyltransferase [Streptomyces sp. NPDC057654]|uniref:class I SAM-dependent methyltransferase n=1 Tax=Streptomyces sp. NPDC057654 TaxID=3346196 RepID=UPI0036AEDF06
MDVHHWDDMYRSRDQVFSGNPNPVLVAEVGCLPPGQALDVGCGEGADALWLARCGWQVTAVDVSEVALRRAAGAAEADVRDRLAWARADLTVAPPPARAFDLVSVHYFPIRREPGHAALYGLLNAVAPGGAFLFVTHPLPDPASAPRSAEYYQPGDIAQLLGPAWHVLVEETRPRAGPRHTHDAVLRASRLR